MYMKKTILIIVSAILVLILSVVAYFYIWGGKPQIDNFADISNDYECIANVALNYYNELSVKDESVLISIREDHLLIWDLETNNKTKIDLNDEQKAALETVKKNFNFGSLRVSKDTVFFVRDETGYYGLVYSKHPLAALYKAELPQDGREYHRINSHWYEWGVWGI